MIIGTLNVVDFNGRGHFVFGLHRPQTKWPPPLESTAFRVPNKGSTHFITEWPISRELSAVLY